jgi:hypothetical protein
LTANATAKALPSFRLWPFSQESRDIGGKFTGFCIFSATAQPGPAPEGEVVLPF